MLDFTSLMAMRQWVNEVETRTGQRPTVIYASDEEIDTYYNTIIGERRQVNTLKVELPNSLEAKGLDFMGIPIVKNDPIYRLTVKQMVAMLKNA